MSSAVTKVAQPAESAQSASAPGPVDEPDAESRPREVAASGIPASPAATGASASEPPARSAPAISQPEPQAEPAPASLYRAAPPDVTLRAVLVRWADMAGWTFQPQHWAVDVDIPLSASAEFSGDFKSAVRGLLGATELADRPLQPCFYGNRVLRVVPLAQSCSRAAASQGAAA